MKQCLVWKKAPTKAASTDVPRHAADLGRRVAALSALDKTAIISAAMRSGIRWVVGVAPRGVAYGISRLFYDQVSSDDAMRKKETDAQ